MKQGPRTILSSGAVLAGLWVGCQGHRPSTVLGPGCRPAAFTRMEMSCVLPGVLRTGAAPGAVGHTQHLLPPPSETCPWVSVSIGSSPLLSSKLFSESGCSQSAFLFPSVVWPCRVFLIHTLLSQSFRNPYEAGTMPQALSGHWDPTGSRIAESLASLSSCPGDFRERSLSRWGRDRKKPPKVLSVICPHT